MLQKQLPRSLPGSLDQELWGEAQQCVCQQARACQQAFQVTWVHAEIQELQGHWLACAAQKASREPFEYF